MISQPLKFRTEIELALRATPSFLNEDKNRIIKIIAIIANIFILSILIIIAKTPPVAGYEISIYEAYPWYFWLFFITSFACGVLILLYKAFDKEKSHWWLIGFWIIILSNGIFLGLPFFRGYFIYPKGDALTHLGLMKDIINTGYIGPDNFYPIVHILGVSLLDITGLSRGAVVNVLYISWYIIYLLNIYLLASVVANHRGQVLVILALASPLVFSYFHTLIHPSILSLFMVPLMLYFYHKREKTSIDRLDIKVALLLLVFTITLAHPVTSIFTMVIFLVFIFSKRFYIKIANQKQFTTQTIINIAADYNVLRIILVVFFAWYFSNALFKSNFATVYNFLVYKSEVSLFTQQIDTLRLAELPIVQTIKLFIYRYGGAFIYLFISAIAVIFILKSSIHKKDDLGPTDFTYSIQFIIALFFSAFSLFGFTGEYDVLRISRFFLILSPIIIGLAICKSNWMDFHGKYKMNCPACRRKVIGLVILLILAVGAINIFNVYRSPRVAEPNWQLSKMEVVGAEWFSSYHDEKIAAATIGVEVRRFEDLTFGYEYPYLNRALLDPVMVASHFGYDKNTSIAETFNSKSRYLLISEAGREAIKIIPENIRYKAHQYTDDDFSKLNSDMAITKIYSNGEFEVWRVYGKRF